MTTIVIYNSSMDALYHNDQFTNFITYLLPLLAFLFQLKDLFKEKEKQKTAIQRLTTLNKINISDIKTNNGIISINASQSTQTSKQITEAYNNDYVQRHDYSIRQTQFVFCLYYIALWLPLIIAIYQVYQNTSFNTAQLMALITTNNEFYLNLLLTVNKQTLICIGLFLIVTAIKRLITYGLYRSPHHIVIAISCFIIGIAYCDTNNILLLNDFLPVITLNPLFSIVLGMIMTVLLYHILYKPIFYRVLMIFHELNTDKPNACAKEIRHLNIIKNSFILTPLVLIYLICHFL